MLYQINHFLDSVKLFVEDIKKEIIECYNKFENNNKGMISYEYNITI